jgi:Tn3 transposase DDE domain
VRLDRWRAIHLVELQDRRHLDEVVPAKIRDHWLNQLMREKYPEPMTVLEWLRRPPVDHALGALGGRYSWLHGFRHGDCQTAEPGSLSEALQSARPAFASATAVRSAPAIVGIVQHDMSLEPIREGWDDLLRLAATIDEGWRSASDVLERFGSAARGDQIYRAGHALGQLLRTVYLCDYFTLPDFRRPLYRVLERGESVHALQRQICTQPLPATRGRRTEELIATSGALTLLTNCVMAWNTQRLQRAVERETQRTAPRYCIDALRSIGPVGHRYINFRGTYRFPVERYANRLAASAA